MLFQKPKTMAALARPSPSQRRLTQNPPTHGGPQASLLVPCIICHKSFSSFPVNKQSDLSETTTTWQSSRTSEKLSRSRAGTSEVRDTQEHENVTHTWRVGKVPSWKAEWCQSGMYKSIKGWLQILFPFLFWGTKRWSLFGVIHLHSLAKQKHILCAVSSMTNSHHHYACGKVGPRCKRASKEKGWEQLCGRTTLLLSTDSKWTYNSCSIKYRTKTFRTRIATQGNGCGWVLRKVSSQSAPCSRWKVMWPWKAAAKMTVAVWSDYHHNHHQGIATNKRFSNLLGSGGGGGRETQMLS